MKREYWISVILGEYYGVFYDNGNQGICIYEGTKDECLTWIENHS